MLHFIFGRAGTGKTRRCCEEIREYMTGAPARTAYLIVPDQATYRAESMLASAFPGKGFVDVSVYGLGRLAYRVGEELHEETDEPVSPLMQQLILRKLLLARGKNLRQLGAASRQTHFAGTLASFFHQLDSFRVGEAELSKLAARAGETPFGRKLSDLTLLYRDYHAYLAEHFRYHGTAYERLAESIPKSEALRNARIWIDGWNGMTPQELSVADALIRTAKDVTVTLPMDPPEISARMTLFDRPYRMWDALSKMAGRSDAVTLSEPHRFTCPRVRELAERFFSPLPTRCRYGKATRTLPSQGVFLAAAPTRREEAASVTRRIARLIRDENFRCKDILVLVRKADPYIPLLRQSFSDCGLPAFFDERRPMKTHPLARLLDTLLRFLAAEEKGNFRGWKKETLFPLLKSDFFPALSDEETDRLENYVLRIGIRPGQWKSPWKFHSPFHLEEDDGLPSGKELDELNEMNALRSRLLDLLIPLTDRWHSSKTVREKCTLLYGLLREWQVPDALALADEKSYAETKERPHIQVWKKILTLLSDFVRAAGDDSMSSADFLTLFEDGLSALTFALIPPTLDHITVTTIDRGYAMEGRAVFLLGAGEGEFPARMAQEGLLTDEELRSARESEGITLGPSLSSLIYQENFYTYLSLTRARDALYISYPTADEDGTELSPSPLLSRMEALGYTTAALSWDAPSPASSDEELLVTPAQSLSLLPSVLREGAPAENSVWLRLRDWALGTPAGNRLLRQKLRGFSYGNASETLSPGTTARLFMPRSPFRTSVSRLETYRKCPYQYFLRYGLRLEEREQGDLAANDFGSYLHAGLHLFGNFLKRQRQSWRDADDEEIDSVSASIAEKVAPRVKSGALLSDGAARYTQRALDRTFRETLRRFRAWSRGSEAETAAMEQAFRLKIQNETDAFLINGNVDRIDIAGGAALVCDYKTGKPDIRLSEIETGYRLQLITYLMAAIEEELAGKGGELLPGALLYIYINGDTRTVPVPKEGEPLPEEKQMAGYFLRDLAFLRKLDTNLGTEDAVLPIKLKKDGFPDAQAPLLTLEEMRALFALAKQNLLTLYASLKQGEIPIRPVRAKNETPCTWCLYKSVCRFDPKLPGCRYEEINLRPDKEVRETLKSI